MAVIVSGGVTTVIAQANVPDACKLTGVTQAVAVSAFGKGALIGNSPTQGGTPPNLGSTCAVGQRPGSPKLLGSIYVEPYAASEFSALEATYRPGLTQTPLHGLGAKAVFAHTSDPSTSAFEFKRGAYAILLTSGAAGGRPARDYPTEADYLTIAVAIYKHLAG
jgi:hypothetical protein